jgi:hypothetical protein
MERYFYIVHETIVWRSLYLPTKVTAWFLTYLFLTSERWIQWFVGRLVNSLVLHPSDMEIHSLFLFNSNNICAYYLEEY